ncbi:MAG TPA: hypothetical protein VEU51_17105 [Candidatus Acidoferrales bacterium]|nr:hypothetical protein [Candidatus Acidoferrales bacterium]
MKPNLTASVAILVLGLMLFPASGAVAADDILRLNVFTDCHCSDPVGQSFCADVKTKIQDSAGFRLAEHPDTYGIGVHLWCIGMFDGLPGIDTKLVGTMSAVSVAFTIYSDRLPGEVYEDSSVFRVGKDAADEMANRIVAAIGQLATANKTVFEHIRATPKPSATATPKVIQ